MPSGRRGGVRGMMLSEEAAETLSFLRAIPKSVACANCLAAYLGVDRYAVLRSIRELIQASRILCTYTECAICQERTLGARERPALRRAFGS